MRAHTLLLPDRFGAVSRLLRRAGALLVILAILSLAGPAKAAFARGVDGTPVGPWTLRSIRALPHDVAGQGVATLTRADGSTTLVLRGNGSIPAGLAALGWNHIGDPDSRHGAIIDAYQGGPGASAKLFVITHPDGTRTYLQHRLAPEETYHDSFAAFSPDGRWFVSGEWGTLRRLLVFAVPAGTPVSSAAQPADLRLASVLTLAQPVSDVQGCVFNSRTDLVCSSSAADAQLFPVADPLLAIHLERPVGRRATTGHVQLLGAVPQDPLCGRVGETEGLDLHRRTLTIAVNSPCRGVTLVQSLAWTGVDDDD